MGLRNIFFAIFEYFAALYNKTQNPKYIAKLQNKLKKNLIKNLNKYEFYKDYNSENFDEFEIIDIQKYRANFEKLNYYKITKDDAEIAANAILNGNKQYLKNDISAGFSTGTSAKQKGIFLTNSFERASYLGQILGKLFSPFELIKIKKIALCLRAESTLYNAQFGAKIKFFPLSTNREEIAKNIIDFAPDIIIAPCQILLSIAIIGKINANLQYCFYGAEAMNSFEAKFIETKIKIKPIPLYQATEGFLASPCKHGKLHLNEDNIFFEFEEICKDYYRPIISDLKRKSQIILRLKLDDIITFGHCECGSPFKVIDKIGRINDIWQYEEKYISFAIEDKIASHIPPQNDWVIIAKPNIIEAYTQNEDDFEIIKKQLEFLKINIINKKYNRQLDFPKRRHIRFME